MQFREPGKRNRFSIPHAEGVEEVLHQIYFREGFSARNCAGGKHLCNLVRREGDFRDGGKVGGCVLFRRELHAPRKQKPEPLQFKDGVCIIILVVAEGFCTVFCRLGDTFQLKLKTVEGGAAVDFCPGGRGS